MSMLFKRPVLFVLDSPDNKNQTATDHMLEKSARISRKSAQKPVLAHIRANLRNSEIPHSHKGPINYSLRKNAASQKNTSPYRGVSVQRGGDEGLRLLWARKSYRGAGRAISGVVRYLL
ncbi:hypothetical protein Zmor_013237 [Zophobas morio]|uniref:Uncharacterized protein n=1 Tax=Zophobas morio TaxID=2755281 RepID=A0AA38MF66_9CUCU|nr:hypothetical protein Zmor_013237 [Zophobas morio]